MHPFGCIAPPRPPADTCGDRFGSWKGRGSVKDILVDSDGEFRCPKCGGKQFERKRTGKAKLMAGVTVGVGALAVPKRMRCLVCGEYSETGKAKPYVDGDTAAERAALDPAKPTTVTAVGVNGANDAQFRRALKPLMPERGMWNRSMDATMLGTGRPLTVATGLSHADALTAAVKLEAAGARVKLTQP
jgi:DNA-directed RNA polymerase subunit RPC12/RpoP